MAVRTPLFLAAPDGEPLQQILEFAQEQTNAVNQFAAYAFSQYPRELRTTGSTGTLLANQGFSDSYYIAGASTTRTDRFSTEAETPNISIATDTYSRIRQLDYTSAPTGDVNNLQFPLYLYNDGTDWNLRAMSRTDFIDTFVTPVLGNFAGGGTGITKSGTYFMTTNPTPANATIVATPAAVNSIADVAAYSAAGIGEALKQTTDTNYYLAKVEYDATAYGAYNTDTLPNNWELPLTYDAGTENILQHSPLTWANLLGPFLQYYLSGGSPANEINYLVVDSDVGADGVAAGTAYVDTRRVPTGTGYTQLFVNADDYRTQEFPNGSESVVAGTNKYFRIKHGP